jgi:hypothetical protein
MAGDIEQILGREGQPGKRSSRPPLYLNPRAWNKGVDLVRHRSSESIAENNRVG